MKRPGKSYPAYYAPPEEERQKAWEQWRDGKAREFRANLIHLWEMERLNHDYSKCGTFDIFGISRCPACSDKIKMCNRCGKYPAESKAGICEGCTAHEEHRH